MATDRLAPLADDARLPPVWPAVRCFAPGDRPVAYAALDAKAYRPGQIALVRVVLLDAHSHAPWRRSVDVRITVRSSSQRVVHEAWLRCEGGCVVSAWELPVGFDEGRYGLSASAVWGGSAPSHVTFVVGDVAPKPARASGKGQRTVRLTVEGESGPLVDRLPTRLYITARDAEGESVEFAGAVFGGQGSCVARFETTAGRARAAFTPRVGEVPYHIVAADTATGRNVRYEFPEVVAKGWALSHTDDAAVAGGGVRLRVSGASPGRGRVALVTREREVASAPVSIGARAHVEVVLTPPLHADGVVRAVVYDDEGRACAERLLYRRPERVLRVEALAETVDETIRLTIKTSSGRGRPAPAIVIVTCVDASRRPPLTPLPAVLLDDELDAPVDGDTLLAPNEASARQLDQLLASQGWRRFGFARPGEFLARGGDAAARVLALRAAPDDLPVDLDAYLGRTLARLRDDLATAERRVSVAADDERRLADLVERTAAAAAEWNARAVSALGQDDDSGASEALRHKRECDLALRPYKERLSEQRRTVERLRDLLRGLEVRVVEAERYGQLLVADKHVLQAEAALHDTSQTLLDETLLRAFAAAEGASAKHERTHGRRPSAPFEPSAKGAGEVPDFAAREGSFGTETIETLAPEDPRIHDTVTAPLDGESLPTDPGSRRPQTTIPPGSATEVTRAPRSVYIARPPPPPDARVSPRRTHPASAAGRSRPGGPEPTSVLPPSKSRASSRRPALAARAADPEATPTTARRTSGRATGAKQPPTAPPDRGEARYSAIPFPAPPARPAEPASVFYWGAGIESDEGTVVVSFARPSRGAKLRLQVEAVGDDGAVGSYSTELTVP